MGDARKPTALNDQDKKLDPQNFAYISDDTYTAEEVEAQTQVGPFGRSLSSFARAAGRRAARVSCTVLDGRCGFPQQLCDTVWFNSLGRRCTPPALAPACGTICSPSVPPPPPPLPLPLSPPLQVIAALVPDRLKSSPNAKMFLRSFWYRATLKQVAAADEMHVYALARCGLGRGGGGGGRGGGGGGESGAAATVAARLPLEGGGRMAVGGECTAAARWLAR